MIQVFIRVGVFIWPDEQNPKSLIPNFMWRDHDAEEWRSVEDRAPYRNYMTVPAHWDNKGKNVWVKG